MSAAPVLRGDRNQCPACGGLFNSTAAFDCHRVGKYGSGRRCRSEIEMVSIGMSKSNGGFGMTHADKRESILRVPLNA